VRKDYWRESELGLVWGPLRLGTVKCKRAPGGNKSRAQEGGALKWTRVGMEERDEIRKFWGNTSKQTSRALNQKGGDWRSSGHRGEKTRLWTVTVTPAADREQSPGGGGGGGEEGEYSNQRKEEAREVVR